MLEHIVGWTSHRTDFKPGMFLESPSGSYYEVLAAKKTRMSAAMDSDEDFYDAANYRKKNKRETGKTEVWEVTLKDLGTVIQKADAKRENWTGVFTLWMATELQTCGGKVWGLNNHVIVTEDFATEQAEKIRAARMGWTSSWEPKPCVIEPEASAPFYPKDCDEQGLDDLSQEVRIWARVWLRNHYLGEQEDESQVNSLLTDALRQGYPLTMPIIRSMMARFHHHVEQNGTLHDYRSRRVLRDEEIQRRIAAGKRAKGQGTLFDGLP